MRFNTKSRRRRVLCTSAFRVRLFTPVTVPFTIMSRDVSCSIVVDNEIVVFIEHVILFRKGAG
jgi:hypothetical protein